MASKLNTRTDDDNVLGKCLWICYMLIKSSPAISHVSWIRITDISDVTSHQILMMGTEMVRDFANFNWRESFRSYKLLHAQQMHESKSQTYRGHLSLNPSIPSTYYTKHIVYPPHTLHLCYKDQPVNAVYCKNHIKYKYTVCRMQTSGMLQQAVHVEPFGSRVKEANNTLPHKWMPGLWHQVSEYIFEV